MAKLKNVSAEELQAAKQAADDFTMMLHDISDRMMKGYCNRIDDPIGLAREFNHAARASSDMVARVIFKMEMQKQEDELAALKARAG